MPALAGILAAVWLAVVSGCGSGDSLPDDGRTQAADEQVRAKWGKPLDELPTATLAVISPHNENIRNEFQWAFSLHHAVEHGRGPGIREQAKIGARSARGRDAEVRCEGKQAR